MEGQNRYELVAEYNRLAEEARGLGLQYRARTFIDAADTTIQAHIDMVRGAIRAHRGSSKEETTTMARRKKGDAPEGATIGQLTEAYNELVPKAQKLGHTRHKHHTSKFGSQEHAQRMLQKIQDDIASGKAAG